MVVSRYWAFPIVVWGLLEISSTSFATRSAAAMKGEWINTWNGARVPAADQPARQTLAKPKEFDTAPAVLIVRK